MDKNGQNTGNHRVGIYKTGGGNLPSGGWESSSGNITLYKTKYDNGQVGIFECDSAAILSTDDIDFGGLKSLKVIGVIVNITIIIIIFFYIIVITIITIIIIVEGSNP